MCRQRFRHRFSLPSIIIPCLLLCATFVPLRAQDERGSAGGNWRAYDSEDKMTAAKRVRFELLSDSSLRANRDDADTRIEILCENGKYRASNFWPGVRLGPPNRPGFWGQPQMEVMVRVDSAHFNHGWNWDGNHLSMDKDTTRGLIGSQIFKIQFLGPRGPIIAEFSPGGIELGRLSQSCHGIEPRRP